MSETIFFQDNGVTVTNSRFVTTGQTHALAGITSVRRYVQTPNRTWPILLIIFGLIGFNIQDFKVIAPILLIAGIAWLFLQKATHSVMISTAAGEVKALSDKNSNRITQIVDALNNAIIHRG